MQCWRKDHTFDLVANVFSWYTHMAFICSKVLSYKDGYVSVGRPIIEHNPHISDGWMLSVTNWWDNEVRLTSFYQC